MDEDNRDSHIAIIGLAGRFPGAEDVDRFWGNLCQGVESISFFSDEELLAEGYPAEMLRRPDCVKAHGALAGIDRFDAELFGYNQREAELIDPQQRLFLEVAYQALEDAGYLPESYGGQIGLFAGASMSTYFLSFVGDAELRRQVGGFLQYLGNNRDFLTTRVSYKLNLKGPSLTVQTACSTSLAAVHLAAQSLLNGECELALAGGVSVSVPQRVAYLYQPGGIRSADGHCRAFDAGATGTASGCGLGIVVLKRLGEAVADGDHVYAVIRGSAINNDGAQKVGFTAPAIEGQAAVISEALSIAGVDPRTVGYVEAHGTGTPLGDPIEVAALHQAFAAAAGARGSCALGSLKPNVGHLDTAAGVAGLIKAALAVRHGLIPPSLHFERPNPEIDFASGPFYVNTRLLPWPEERRPRRAGVSSFGLGGTNVHVVLEEPPPPAPSAAARTWQALVLSGRTPELLDRAAHHLADHLERRADLDLADVAFTLQVGRRELRHRRTVLCRDREEAIRALRGAAPEGEPGGEAAALSAAVRGWLDGGRVDWRDLHAGEARRRVPLPPTPMERRRYWIEGRSVLLPTAPGGEALAAGSAPGTRSGRPVAFLFPGVGDHYPGMARELYETEPTFRREVDLCCELLAPRLGLDLRDTLYPGGPAPDRGDRGDRSEGPDLRRLLGRAGEAAGGPLRSTRLAQPAVFVVEIALAKLWASWGVEPAALLGYSLGEYTAACLAGVFSLEDALVLVAERARLIDELPEGAMLAVSLPEAEVVPLLDRKLSLAATYTPGVCVVAGPLAPMAALERELTARGAVHRRVGTAHALHSTMMEPLAGRLVELFEGVDLQPPRIPYLSNVTGTWITPREATDPSFWARHLCRTARFAEALEKLLGAGEGEAEPVLLEVGPGQALSIAARQHPARPADQPVIASLREAHDRQPDTAFLLGALDRLRRAGVRVDRQIPGEGTRSAAPGRPQPRSSRVRAVLAEIFEQTCGLTFDGADLDAHFAELGLHSLSLMQVSQGIRERLGVAVAFRRLLEELTSPAALLAQLEAELPEPAQGEAQETSAATATDEPSGPVLERILERIEGLSRQVEDLRRSGLPGGSPRPPAAPAPLPEPAAAPGAGPWRPVRKDAARRLNPRQERHLAHLTARYCRRTATSKQIAQQHRAVLADVRVPLGFRRLWKELIYPITAERSAGSRLWDVDGNEYVDLLMGFGVNLLGYSPPFIMAAVAAQLERGVHLGPQTGLAGEVAERICAMTGCERVAFCNTGSEAVLIALRLARTVSGRDRIALFRGSYHGLTDPVLAAVQGSGDRRRTVPAAPGIPASMVADSLVLEYGDAASLDLIERQAGTLGAVLVEPVQAGRPGFVPREFLRELRALTERLGIPLIFDEMITGFRVHPGGIQAVFGIQADLATYGKVVGGGLPIGVVGGRRAFLDAVDGGTWQFGDDSYPVANQTYIAGTFSKYPLSLAAARAVLEHLEAAGPALQVRLNERTAALAAELDQVFASAGAPIRVDRFSSLFQITPSPDLEFADLLQYHLIERGIHLWGGRRCFLSTAHEDADLRRIVEAVAESVAEMQDAELLPRSAATVRGALPPSGELAGEGLVLPLTESQRALWFLCQLGEEASRAYHEAQALRLRGPLDPAAMQRALQRVADRHEALRAAFDEGGEAQRILPRVPAALPSIDLAGLPAAARREEAERCLRRLALERFDTARAPLWRCALLRLAAGEHLLALVFHHLVIDDWSLGIVFDELCRGYAAALRGQADEPASAARFSDYVRAETGAGQLAADEAYWLRRFTPLPPVFELPADRPRPPVESFSGRREVHRLDASLLAGLRQLGKNRNSTLFMSLLAGFEVLLHRLTTQPDLVVGMPVAGQSAVPGGRLVGYCIRVLPIRSQLPEGRRFAEHLAETRRAVLDAYEHQAYSLARLVQRLGLERDPSRPPLVAVGFNMDGTGNPVPAASPAFGGLEVEEVEVPLESAKLDLNLNLVETRQGLRATLEYRDDLLDAPTVRRWLAALERLLRAAADDPDLPVEELPLLGQADRFQLLVEWNDTATIHGEDRLAHELFEAWARRAPEAPAVDFNGEVSTYGQLDVRANRLARLLSSLGVGPEVPVGVCVERSCDLVTALLAIWKAGGAYLPLDPSYPPERLAFMAADSNAAVVLTQSHLALPPLPGARRVALDREAERIAALSGESSGTPVDPGNLAYTIYTSGSTGRPKGVELSHRGLSNLIAAQIATFAAGPGSRVLQFSSASFDASIFETVMALAAGACLHLEHREALLPGPGLAALLRERRITHATLTPSALAALPEVELPDLRTLVVAGEACPPDLVERWAGGRRFWNAYGPTETTVWATVAACRAGSGKPPIGRPVANVRTYVLDSGLRPVPLGVAGELYLGGRCVARGYHGRPDLTAERFVPDPFGGEPAARLYRTGDLVRQRPDGSLDFLGRVDHQVKLRGFRIELQEVEAALGRHPAVQEAAVAVREGEGLVAYLAVGREAPPDVDELRELVRRTLPDYMVPSAFVAVEALPLTHSGKVDRRALAVPGSGGRLGAKREGRAPRTPAEATVAALWTELLGLDRVDVDDDFFTLGGHSLLVPRILLRLREAFGVDLSVKTFFAAPSVAGLAALLEPGETAAGEPDADPLDLAAEVELDPGVRPRDTVAWDARWASPAAVFLTGGTGFVGAFLLHELLERTDAVVHCLVRAADAGAARERLRRHLQTWRLWRPDLAPRIVPVTGDLTRPLLGLSPGDFDRLAGSVDAVYHCGAWVNFTYPYGALAPSNVQGTREALRLTTEGRPKPFHYVSTLSVFDDPSLDVARVLREDDDLPEADGLRLADGYAQSKWVAEKIVHQARLRGLPVTIYRPHLIGGHSRTGAGNPRDLVWCWLKGILQLAAVDESTEPLDVAPVDYVSRAIVHLSRQESSPGRAFHLLNPRPLPAAAVFDVIESLGYPLRRLGKAEWVREVLAAIAGGAENALAPFLPFFEQQKRTASAQRDTPRFDDRNTREGLAGSGIECPPVTPELLRTYIGYFIASGFLEPPGGGAHAPLPAGPDGGAVAGKVPA